MYLNKCEWETLIHLQVFKIHRCIDYIESTNTLCQYLFLKLKKANHFLLKTILIILKNVLMKIKYIDDVHNATNRNVKLGCTRLVTQFVIALAITIMLQIQV